MSTIMVVDDDYQLARLATHALEAEGHTVATYLDPNQALEVYKKEPGGFALVLSDIKMPGMNGVQLARAIWKINPRQVVLFMSGDFEGIELPKDSICLRKPFGGLKALINQVDILLEKQQ